MSINIIHIFGASGSGTSTLAKALEKVYSYRWLDTDDFFWEQTDPPYVTARVPEMRLQLIYSAISESSKCVISGSLYGWGDPLIPLFDLAIYIDTPTDVRIERLRKREYIKFGDRIRKGGDMYNNHEAFIEWARNYEINPPYERSRIGHMDWLSTLSCSKLQLDGTKPVEILVNELSKYL